MKVDDRDHLVAARIGFDELGGGIARAPLVRIIHAGIVEEQHHIVRLRLGPGGRIGLG